ncbi:MAG: glucosaminidase domain-containing protein [Saprospiraceae bacterium]|nr:glucosaminidase domain-containing protein [Saprospiraceae bacterium]
MQFTNSRTTKWNGRPERSTYNQRSQNNLHFEKKRPSATFSLKALLRLIAYGLRRLFVALKYQVIQLDLGRIKLPWFRLAVAGILLYLIFQRDLQFQVHMNAPGQQQHNRAVSNQETNMSLSQSLLPEHQQEVPSTPVPEVDPFDPVAGDSPEELSAKTYLRRFHQVAVAEMKKFGIPASIKMAQGLLESQAGKSRLAVQNQNHFGIKCFSTSCPQGHCSNFPDDHHKDFFRIYDSAWASWRAHSEMLSTGKYKELLKLGTDYRAWAHGLSELGYATDPNYEATLIRIIEKYKLDRLDSL